MKLVFATNNAHKMKEVRKIIPSGIDLLTLKDIDCEDELPETGNTLQANALQKARYVHDKFGVDCFADDTGLEVAALDGRPGVYSARYAGINADPAENILKLLTELNGVEDRRASFTTVVALYLDDKEYFFEGSIEGAIAIKQIGENGFGYDPVFIPKGYDKTFAEMSADEKNSMSHRAIAMGKLSEFLIKI